MTKDYKKNFTDRLQFLGVIGPVGLVLTLLAVLMKQAMTGWYLFCVATIALPLIWKLHFKGLVLSVALTLTLYMAHFSIYTGASHWWYLAASCALIASMWATYLGFEEIKDMLSDLQIESQSRLDNLIELDEQLKKSELNWSEAEAELKEELLTIQQTKVKLIAQAENSEQAVEIIRENMKSSNRENKDLLNKAEALQQELSKRDIEQLEQSEKIKELTQKLSVSISDRELELQDQIAELENDVNALTDQLGELLEQAELHDDYEVKLSQKDQHHQAEISRLNEVLKDKVANIYSLEGELNQLSQKNSDSQQEAASLDLKLKEYEQSFSQLQEQANAKEQKIGSYKNKIKSFERNIEDLNQQLIKGNQRIQNLQKEKEEIENSQEYLQSSSDQKLKMKNFEVEALNKELKQKNNQVNRLLQRNSEVDQTIHMYEAQVRDLQVELESYQKDEKKQVDLLNEARVALFQANLDKERIQKEKPKAFNLQHKEQVTNKHWLLQLQGILQKSKYRKVDLEHLPKDLSKEIITLGQTKALYKQLREQFEDKAKILDEVREKLFKAETQQEKLKKEYEQMQSSDSKLENELEKKLFVKEEEIKIVEEELLALHRLVDQLLNELSHSKN